MWNIRSLYVKIAGTVGLGVVAAGVALTASADPPGAFLKPPLGAQPTSPAPAKAAPETLQVAPREVPMPPALGPHGAGMPILPMTPIDLPSALKLAGVDNPEVLIARQRVLEAVAVRQLAAAQILPSLNVGLNYDAHTGPLQQSSGKILDVNRSSMYLGAGANAVAAGTVSIPGVVYNLNVSDAIFTALIAKQGVERAKYANAAVKNEAFRRVGVAYTELLRAEGARSVAFQTREEARAVAEMTAAFAKAGQGTQADADRAASELARRNTDLVQTENEVLIASARLAELLAIDQTVRLHPIEDKIIPTPMVPDPIPLQELLAIAVLQRPELGEQQAALRQAMLALHGAKMLPFSPTMIVGFSSGTSGGGSGLLAQPGGFGGVPQQSRFGNFGQRNDFDVVAYWTLQNVGLGNRAMIKGAAANLGKAELEKLAVLNRVRREVAEAYVRTHVRFAQVAPAEAAALSGQRAFKEDFARVRGNVGLPIELLQSLKLLAEARTLYLDAIVRYNEAQIDLYVALGQPPADTLARPVPTNFTPSSQAPPNPPR